MSQSSLRDFLDNALDATVAMFPKLAAIRYSGMQVISIPGDKRQPGVTGAWSIVANNPRPNSSQHGGGNRQISLAVIPKDKGPEALDAKLRGYGARHLIRA